MLDEKEMSKISACMTAMLEGLEKLEMQGLLVDGYNAMAGAVEVPGGGYDVTVTLTGTRRVKAVGLRL